MMVGRIVILDRFGVIALQEIYGVADARVDMSFPD